MTTCFWRRVAALCAIAASGLASVSCGSVTRSGRSPAFLVVDQLRAASGASPGLFAFTLASDVRTNGGILADHATAVMYMLLKDNSDPTNAAVPSTANRLKINRYRVVYKRSDGRNTPGVDVPYPFDGAITATITQSTSQVDFTLVRVQAKLEAPLSTLAGAGGAIVISTIADITFYGEDLAGNAFQTTASISVNFADWADPDSSSSGSGSESGDSGGSESGSGS